MCLNILMLCDLIIFGCVKYIILDFFNLNVRTVKENLSFFHK